MNPLLQKIGLCCCAFISACSLIKPSSSDQLLRNSYVGQEDHVQHDYFVYLPKNYARNSRQRWPVLLFLHGDGERGNGKDELDFVLKHGPLYEAWIQKKELPFIIISPQLPMFGRDKIGINYLVNRDPNSIPRRLASGVPARESAFPKNLPLQGLADIADMSKIAPLLPDGWERVEEDLLGILQQVQQHYRTDPQRLYLTGLSYGGFGTWYMANRHPDLFAAIVPVVGWGHPSLMGPIAQAKLPVWAFAGGRDEAVDKTKFYAGLRALEAFGSSELRFTVHEDMAHDAWKRVYASDDLYQWLLDHKK